MNKYIKGALLFTSGVTVGVGVCGIKMVTFVLTDEYFRDALVCKITDKADKWLFGNDYTNYNRSNDNRK